MQWKDINIHRPHGPHKAWISNSTSTLFVCLTFNVIYTEIDSGTCCRYSPGESAVFVGRREGEDGVFNTKEWIRGWWEDPRSFQGRLGWEMFSIRGMIGLEGGTEGVERKRKIRYPGRWRDFAGTDGKKRFNYITDIWRDCISCIKKQTHTVTHTLLTFNGR